MESKKEKRGKVKGKKEEQNSGNQLLRLMSCFVDSYHLSKPFSLRWNLMGAEIKTRDGCLRYDTGRHGWTAQSR